jgi:ABC-type multidrug transport system ATPase subunit
MIEIRNVSKSYQQKSVLCDTTFSMEYGKVYGLLGMNGAGKTTLMKIICSLVFPDSGSIFWDGIPYSKDSSPHNIGYMIEDPTFYGYLSGEQNLRLLSKLYGSVDFNRIEFVLKTTGMYDHRHTLVKKYSKGMKQRLYFAYALLNHPKLIVLDEPFNGIDPVTIRHFRELISELAKEGNIVFLSSHMIADIKLVCDEVYIIDKGRLVYHDDVLPSQDLETIFVTHVSADGCAQ